MNIRYPRRLLCLTASLAAIFFSILPAKAVRVRDVARLNNEVPNELEGMGLVVGLHGTGDGGDYSGAMRPLMALMKNFDNPVTLEKELKNANNVAIVTLRVNIPSQGIHAGDRLDVQVSSIGAAKSLKGGQLFITPLVAPRSDIKIVLGSASGELLLDDEKHPTTATIHNGAVMTEDVLPEPIRDGQFTLILHKEAATAETASAMADQINEDLASQTGGKPAAIAVDATSVNVTIPKAEQANPTAFIARIRNLALPTIPEPAKVIINTKTKTIVFTEEVELAPTTISFGVGMTIEITSPPPPAATNGAVAIDPRQFGNAKLKDLVEAFKAFRVSPDDRIAIIKQLHDTNILKADLEIK
jgi:flagellar P-ring protein precursor FlgI